MTATRSRMLYLARSSGLLLLCLASTILAIPLRASTLEYALEIPDGEDGAFEVQFQVDNPGRLEILAEWSGARVISFRVDGPGEPPTRLRRSGPSPQRVSIDVPPAASGAQWKLSIRALASRGTAKGTLTVALPDPPQVIREREKAETSAPPPPPKPEAWQIAARPPEGASAELIGLYEGIERLRSSLLAPSQGPRPDGCGWQTELLRALTQWRDRLSAGEPPPSESTLRYLGRLSAAVGSVEELRKPADPILAGPVPQESLRRRAWLTLRKERLRPLEAELDSLRETLRGGYIPDFSKEIWPGRFVACLTACERHFEERVRVGPEEATNRDLAEAQWDRFLAARVALERLAGFLEEPGLRSSSGPAESASGSD